MAKRRLVVELVGDSSSLDRALGKSQKNLGTFGTMAKRAGALAGVSLGAGMAAAGQATVDFDKSMRNVNSIAQLNEKQYKKLSKSVRGLAGPTAQAPKTLADGMYTLVSSGFKAQDALKVLRSSAKAATAGPTDTETSTAAVAACSTPTICPPRGRRRCRTNCSAPSTAASSRSRTWARTSATCCRSPPR